MKEAKRIVSFLPSATEMVYALGLEERLAGVTHECDFPPAAMTKPVVVRSVLPVEEMSQNEIDVAVTARLRNGESLYQVNEALMRTIAPDLIVTQDLCQVCAPSGNEVTKVLAALKSKPEILFLTPRTLGEMFGNITALGRETGTERRAAELIASLQGRVDAVETRARTATSRPRVFCMEWLDPVYCSGHWVPEMVRIAGGEDSLGRLGTDSVRIAWDDVRDWAPEILLVMPCGFHLADVLGTMGSIFRREGWAEIPAVKNHRLYAVDASSYFARPGPRLVDGVELLAHLIHPELFDWKGPADAFSHVELVQMPSLLPQ